MDKKIGFKDLSGWLQAPIIVVYFYMVLLAIAIIIVFFGGR